MEFWAVSDTALADLEELQNLLVSYFPAQKCLLQMSKIQNCARGLWPFSHFSSFSFSFWPGPSPAS